MIPTGTVTPGYVLTNYSADGPLTINTVHKEFAHNNLDEGLNNAPQVQETAIRQNTIYKKVNWG